MKTALYAMVFTLAAARPLAAQGGAQEDAAASQYRIDWYGGFLTATAWGTADAQKAVDQAHLKSMALQTARHLAIEKLAETIGGVKISGRHDYTSIIGMDSKVKLEVDAFVKDARELEKEPVALVMADGSILARSTVGIRLLGNDSIAARTFSIPAVHAAIEEAGAGEDKPAPAAAAAAPRKQAPTGLIVDVRGLLSFRPGLTVKIVSAGGKTVYGADVADEGVLNGGEMVRYAASEEDARKSAERIGKSPLAVKAESVLKEDPSAVVVSEEDAAKINAAAGDFLRKGKVIFVL